MLFHIIYWSDTVGAAATVQTSFCLCHRTRPKIASFMIADVLESGLRPINHCCLPEWTCPMSCPWGRSNRLRLLCSMEGCGKNWMRMKRKLSWSLVSSHFMTLMTWKFCEAIMDQRKYFACCECCEFMLRNKGLQNIWSCCDLVCWFFSLIILDRLYCRYIRVRVIFSGT